GAGLRGGGADVAAAAGRLVHGPGGDLRLAAPGVAAMTTDLAADFERRFPGGPVIQGQLRIPLDGFSVTVLFGPSGSRKTAVLRCLAGLERPDRGQIRFGPETWFDAEAGIHLPPQRRGIGYLSQDYALFPHLTVAGNIGYGLGGLDATERQRRIDEMVRLFG